MITSPCTPTTLPAPHYVAGVHRAGFRWGAAPARGRRAAPSGPDLLGFGAPLGERHRPVVLVHDLVPGVAFDRLEPGVPDQVQQIRAVHRVRGAVVVRLWGDLV